MSTHNHDDPQKPSDDELQERAREVWGRVKRFYAMLGIGTLVVLTLCGTVAYQSFGFRGLIVGIVIFVVALVLIGFWLLTF